MTKAHVSEMIKNVADKRKPRAEQPWFLPVELCRTGTVGAFVGKAVGTAVGVAVGRGVG